MEQTSVNATWWNSLTVAEKERIASKVTGEPCPYPQCTAVWLSLDDDKKAWIQAHCTKDHGITTPDWTEGKVFSY